VGFEVHVEKGCLGIRMGMSAILGDRPTMGFCDGAD
jgi:hypothetical protein